MEENTAPAPHYEVTDEGNPEEFGSLAYWAALLAEDGSIVAGVRLSAFSPCRGVELTTPQGLMGYASIRGDR